MPLLSPWSVEQHRIILHCGPEPCTFCMFSNLSSGYMSAFPLRLEMFANPSQVKLVGAERGLAFERLSRDVGVAILSA
eukprot:gene17891-biopygen23382